MQSKINSILTRSHSQGADTALVLPESIRPRLLYRAYEHWCFLTLTFKQSSHDYLFTQWIRERLAQEMAEYKLDSEFEKDWINLTVQLPLSQFTNTNVLKKNVAASDVDILFQSLQSCYPKLNDKSLDRMVSTAGRLSGFQKDDPQSYEQCLTLLFDHQGIPLTSARIGVSFPSLRNSNPDLPLRLRDLTFFLLDFKTE